MPSNSNIESSPPSTGSIRNVEKERGQVTDAFLKWIISVLGIVTIAVAQVSFGYLANDLWMSVAGILNALLLLGAVPVTIGEYPFFSKRTTPMARFLIFPVWVILVAFLNIITVLLRGAYPMTLVEGVYSVVYVVRLLPLSVVFSLVGFFFKTVSGRSARALRQVKIAVPKWITLRTMLALAGWIHPIWAVSTPEMMKRLHGVPIVIFNSTHRTLVLTMMWLEWFAPLTVTKSFHREYVLRNLFSRESRTYQRKVIELDRMEVLKPNDSIVWTLTWSDARSFYEDLLRRSLVECSDEVSLRITVYDEYADRVHGSREISLRAVIAEERLLEKARAR